MNKIVIMMLAIITFLLLSGCGNKVAEAAKQFTNAIETQDFAGAKEFATEDSQDLLNQAEYYWEQLTIAEKEDITLKKYNIVETSVKGDNATVILDEINAQDRSRKETREIKMVKENGLWKVKLDSESESILPGS